MNAASPHPAYLGVRLLLVLTLLAGFGQPATHAVAAAPAQTATPCEPWQEPDGYGGCVDRCDADHEWDDVNKECKEKPKPCPAGTIDIQGNGRNDGGEDCQALDVMAPVNSHVYCTPGPSEMLMPSGTVTCYTTIGAGLSVRVSPGCSAIARTPFPRAMVNVPITFQEVGILPAVTETEPGGVGWYRYNSGQPWQVSGWRLDEKYAYRVADTNGEQSFDMRSQIPADDVWKYPSINGVRIWLDFERVLDYGEDSEWQISLQSSTGVTYSRRVVRGQEYLVTTGFRRSSHPIELGGSSAEYVALDMAPDQYGGNTLPGLKIGLSTTWSLFYVASWDEYVVNGSNEYVWARNQSARVLVGRYTSLRAWDQRQGYTESVRPIYCNALAGFVPVPVLEGQSVLVP